MEPSAKRRRLSHDAVGPVESVDKHPGQTPASLSRSISPPRRKKLDRRMLIPSPFQLTTIRDLPKDCNVDAVPLRSLIGDQSITEYWDFNYLHDVDFMMQSIGQNRSKPVKLHIVHGFWKREDIRRTPLAEQAKKYNDVTLHAAYTGMYGTHHSKMMVLFRHGTSSTAQVVIHTANSIPQDWTNLTNGVWQSPLLPLLNQDSHVSSLNAKFGSGARFKADLLRYLRAYNTRQNVCTPLVTELMKYDFSSVRGALIASVPGKHDVEQPPELPCWGWPGLKRTIQSVPTRSGPSDIVAQVSSLATLGGTDTWLQKTLFDALAPTATLRAPQGPKPDFKVVFPTADEIRRSLNGYESGGSIHTKIQSKQQEKQLNYLRPIFHHWANDCDTASALPRGTPIRDAGRKRAAPHIKTYTRHHRSSGALDWALLTSANVSKQAWGEAISKAGEVHIASWEIGVLVWPELLADAHDAKMVPTFRTDGPSRDAVEGDCPLVGLRLPYNLPLQRYADDEVPWVATAKHLVPDWKGRIWDGY
ncbi:phospholipase D/nuclease [Xylariomycetidae sp. FL0641]|nr:phospholipase D/nuclease [Xylariomycetidae sp. FL0641]